MANNRFRTLRQNNETYVKQLTEDLTESTKALQDFYDDPDKKNELGEPMPGIIPLIEEQNLIMRDLLRRCVASEAMTMKCFDINKQALDLLSLVDGNRLDVDLVQEYSVISQRIENSKEKASGQPEDCFAERWPRFWDMSYRHEWSNLEDYFEGDIVFLQSSEDDQIHWFEAATNVLRTAGKRPIPKRESPLWKMSNKYSSKPHPNHDLGRTCSSYLSLSLREFRESARNGFPQVTSLEDRSMVTNLLATVSMLVIVHTYNPERHKALREKKIKPTLKWLKSHPAELVNACFDLANRFVVFWPPAVDVRERVDLVVLYAGDTPEEEQALNNSLWGRSGEKRCLKKQAFTNISLTHPIQSILMYIHSVFEWQYDPLDHECAFQICHLDQHSLPIDIQRVSTTANGILSRSIRKSQRDGPTKLIVKITDHTVRKRPVFPFCFRIEKIVCSDVEIRMPVGVSLAQARQFQSDHVYTRTHHPVFELEVVPEVPLERVMFQDLVDSEEYHFLDRGDEVERGHEATISIAEYAVDQGCMDMYSGEQSATLCICLEPDTTDFYSTDFMDLVKSRQLSAAKKSNEVIATEEHEREVAERARLEEKNKIEAVEARAQIVKEKRIQKKKEKIIQAITIGTRKDKFMPELETYSLQELRTVYAVVKHAEINDDDDDYEEDGK